MVTFEAKVNHQLLREKMIVDKEKRKILKKIRDGWGLGSFEEKWKSDKDVVLAALENTGRDLEYADVKFRGDKDVVLAAVKEAW